MNRFAETVGVAYINKSKFLEKLLGSIYLMSSLKILFGRDMKTDQT